MASKYYRKKNYKKKAYKKRNYKKNAYYKKKTYKKKGFSYKNYRIIKKIVQKVIDSPYNVEYNQLKAPVRFCNFATFMTSGNNPNFRFYPLTCLGQLGENNDNLNGMYIQNFVKFINRGDEHDNTTGVGFVEGTKISIKYIQVKGVMRLNQSKDEDVQEVGDYCGVYGFRIVRQRGNLNDTFINNWTTAYANKVMPTPQTVYKNLPSSWSSASNNDLLSLRTNYNKDSVFDKNYETVGAVYWHVNNQTTTMNHREHKVNRIFKFKKPLEITWNTAADIDKNVNNGFYLSSRNNLYLCPFFSKVDSGIDAHALREAFFDFEGQIYINYLDR